MLFDGLIINKIMSFVNPDLDSMRSLLMAFGRENCPYRTLDIYYDQDYDTIDVNSGKKSKKNMYYSGQNYQSIISGPNYTIYSNDNVANHMLVRRNVYYDISLYYSYIYVTYYCNITGPVIVFRISGHVIAVSLYSINIFMDLYDKNYFDAAEDEHTSPMENRMFDSFGHHHFIFLNERARMIDLNKHFIMSTEYR